MINKKEPVKHKLLPLVDNTDTSDTLSYVDTTPERRPSLEEDQQKKKD